MHAFRKKKGARNDSAEKGDGLSVSRLLFLFPCVVGGDSHGLANLSLSIWCVSAATNGARRVRQWKKISSGERRFPGRERRSKRSVIIRIRLLSTGSLNLIKFLLLCYGGMLVSTAYKILVNALEIFGRTSKLVNIQKPDIV